MNKRKYITLLALLAITALTFRLGIEIGYRDGVDNSFESTSVFKEYLFADNARIIAIHTAVFLGFLENNEQELAHEWGQKIIKKNLKKIYEYEDKNKTDIPLSTEFDLLEPMSLMAVAKYIRSTMSNKELDACQECVRVLDEYPQEN